MSRVDYRGLAALDAVIAHGSFDKAALALSITQSAVSQRLRMLENQAGELLVIRSQPPAATQAGQCLIAHYRQVQLLESALAQQVRSGPQERPELAIAVNADSAATWLQEALTPLLADGGCLLHLHLDDQDHTLAMLREGRVFACITSETAQVAGTTATALGAMRYQCLASPAFAARWFPQGLTAEAVQSAPALHFNRKDALTARFIAQHTGYTGRYPHHSYDTSEGFVRFLEAGIAYGMAPTLQCAAQLDAGTLVDLAAGHVLDVPLYWYRWDIATPLTQALSEAVVTAGRRALMPLRDDRAP